MKKFYPVALAIVTACASMTASAAEGSGAYVRGEVGNSNLRMDGETFTDTAMSGWFGYGFNKVVALEAHYGSLGSDSEDGYSIEMTAAGAGIRLKYDFESLAYIAGRVGMESIDTEVGGLGVTVSDSANKAYYGIGLGYPFTDHFAITGYWDSRNVPMFGSDERVDTLTVGGEYTF